MDLAFSATDLAFRDQVRAFIAERLPGDIRAKVAGGVGLAKDDFVRWQRILHAKGWIAPHWPVEQGGPGWSATQRYIFDEELALGHAPYAIPFGLKMVGPVIYTFGTAAQKRHFLPRILASEDWWCQGYSEPGSGSDLASLQMKTERRGDHYRLNGTKTWTTYAHWADWMFCLVRTSGAGKQQEGISFLLLDMRTPGIEVKPILTIDGQHHVNMVYFTDVRVPVENRIGEENKGWTYAKFLLGFERTDIADVGPSKQRLARLKAIARAEMVAGRPLLADDDFAAKLADIEIQLLALETTSLRHLAAEAAGKPIGPEASLLKIRGSEIRQRLTELAVEAVGYYALPMPEGLDRRNEPPIGPEHAAPAMPDYLFSRAASIYGGSNEIQKNIIAKMVLGL
ncbi:MAG: pimeloyl-CoA dehydrogenase large subunit [Alphaproteobacteria bacterium]|nr:pimeloyl-CoA dehydrogenase large subunit [Alphaproteobacteria bacterium]